MAHESGAASDCSPFLNFIRKGLRRYNQGGVAGLWAWAKHEIIPSIAFAALTWGVLLSYWYFHLPPEIFSPTEIADYAYGLVVSIAESNDTVPLGTGFWVNRNGYLVTCNRSARGLTPGVSGMHIGSVLSPIFSEKLADITGAAIYYNGRMEFYDDNTGLAIFWTPDNPFRRDPWSIWAARSGKLPAADDTSSERFHVPKVSSEMLKPGDHIYVLGVENEQKNAFVRTVEGMVERMGEYPDDKGKSYGPRAFTNVNIQRTYFGAPVLNASEEVIGVVCDSCSPAVIVPAKDILRVIARIPAGKP